MLINGLVGVRERWGALVGSFVALALGVGVVAAMGFALGAAQEEPERVPRRFAGAEVVVRGADTVRVASPHGAEVRVLERPNAVPAALVRELGAVGRVVEDRSFGLRAEGGPGELVGHPWSVAAFGAYALRDGRAPRADDEVVVGGDWAAPGQRIRTTRGTVRVVGVAAAPRPYEDAVFFGDRRAAEIAPGSVQLVVVGGGADAVRGVVRGYPGVRVLTGSERRLADADPGRDQEAVTALTALFGTAAGVTGFVSVFVVASTFAFTVAQRRREFGLLRTAGATAGQLRRALVAEALLVGVVAGGAGCVLGGWGAPRLGRWAVAQGLAPDWFVIRTGAASWPYHLAFWTGLAVALCGVLAASWRAGRTGPAQAMREVSVDGRVMTWGRIVVGGGLLVTALVTLGTALAGDPGELLHRKTYVVRPMLLIGAVALIAPALVRPLLRLGVLLPARLPGATGMLVRENATAGLRRTAAVAAPVLATVALAGSLLGATGTIAGAKAAEARERTVADYVVTPQGADGFDAATLRRLRQVEGATVSPTAATTLYVPEDGGVALVTSEARAADPALLARTTRLPVVAGRLADLTDDTVVVNEEWQRHTVGERVDVRLGDGTRRSLRIAAVLRTGTGDNGAYVTARNAAGAPVDRVDVTVADGRAAADVGSALRAAVHGTGAAVVTKSQWLEASHPATNRTTRLGLFLVLGIALLYTAIAVANVTVMATTDRTHDLTALRLAGATRAQTLRVVAAEALAVTVTGGVLGLLVAAANVLGMHLALIRLHVDAPFALPWTALAATSAACVAIAVVSAVLAARFGPALRGRSVRV
ncbi:FtsX-like permease family protein [Streptomyces sp. KL116D]|uniref:FtsX-like permease family protein n=1 Tax=Streptomyces sp. KL116D TaxID=3045152 RepID=UPI0035590192